ncbi:MAG: DUF5658 family protein [Planctomycetota bacterium]
MPFLRPAHPQHDAPQTAVAADHTLRLPFFYRPVCFPHAYTWIVFLSAMDVLFTKVVLALGGREVNPVAETVINGYGLPGTLLFKFTLVVGFLLICEYVGRQSESTGRFMSRTGLVIAAFPIVWSSLLLASVITLAW